MQMALDFQVENASELGDISADFEDKYIRMIMLQKSLDRYHEKI